MTIFSGSCLLGVRAAKLNHLMRRNTQDKIVIRETYAIKKAGS